MTAFLAACVSRGFSWPDAEYNVAPVGDVIIFNAEDDAADTTVHRLNAHDADLSRIHDLTGVCVTLPNGKDTEQTFTLGDLSSLKLAIKSLACPRLIIIDPINSFIGSGVDCHRDNEIRTVLGPLHQLASDTGIAIVMVTHTRKSSVDHADDAVLGGRAFVGLARAVLHVTEDPNNRQRRLLLPGKNNLSHQADGLAFAINGIPARLEWEQEPLRDYHADDAMKPRGDGIGSRGPMPEKRNAVANWLIDLLRAGPMNANDVRSEAESAGHSWRTVERAKTEIGIIVNRSGFHSAWRWSLPDDFFEDRQPDMTQAAKQEELGGLRGNTAENLDNPSENGIGRQVDDHWRSTNGNLANVQNEHTGELFAQDVVRPRLPD